MTEPLTDQQLTVLVTRLTYRPTLQGPESNPWLTLHNTVDDQERDRFIAAAFTDVPVLLAEVARLRAELADEQAAHAKTIDNFEIASESLTSTISTLESRLDSIRAAAKSIQEQRDSLLTEAVKARAKVRAIEQVRCWTNEDGRGFLFANDVRAALTAARACTCSAEPVHQAGCPSA